MSSVANETPNGVDPARTKLAATRLSVATGIAGLTLAALSLGWIPSLRYQWAMNLWSYLPLPVVAALACSALALCSAAVRRFLLDRLGALEREVSELSPALVAGLLFVIASALLYEFRERAIYGDSKLILMWGLTGRRFVIPDLGSTWLTSLVFRAAVTFASDPVWLLQLASVVLGGIALLLLRGLAGRLWPERSTAVVLWIAGGGLMRVFAGHIEVYAVLLPAVLGFLWASLAHVDGKVTWWVPALAAGVAIWTHLSAILLLPGLCFLALVVQNTDGSPGWIWRLVRAGAVAAAPSLAFLAVMGWTGDLWPTLEHQLPKILDILGQAESDGGQGMRWWVRGWGGEPSVGTDVVFLSRAHWKYLLNAAFLLVPSTLPIAVVGLACWPGALRADRKLAFLAVVSLPLLAYPTALRPFWGPYDWDLFSMTAVCVGALAARLLALRLAPASSGPLLLVLVVLQLVFVGLPFLSMSAFELNPAGPFASFEMLTLEIMEPLGQPNEAMAPWL